PHLQAESTEAVVHDLCPHHVEFGQERLFLYVHLKRRGPPDLGHARLIRAIRVHLQVHAHDARFFLFRLFFGVLRGLASPDQDRAEHRWKIGVEPELPNLHSRRQATESGWQSKESLWANSTTKPKNGSPACVTSSAKKWRPNPKPKPRPKPPP